MADERERHYEGEDPMKPQQPRLDAEDLERLRALVEAVKDPAVGAVPPEQARCLRCEGDGSYSELAPCTTCGSDCACNGPRVIVDPCPDCGGSGEAAPPHKKGGEGNA